MLALTAGLALAQIPTYPLNGGGAIPALAMGGNDFASWFQVANKPAMIQTFHGYGNGQHLAPQIKAAGRENVFVSTGIPCGCCGSDAPAHLPMNMSEAMDYIKDEMSQLDVDYVDLLLMHHRCKTEVETQAVWAAFEATKKAGKARHIGVSNFNTYDLKALMEVAELPIEVLEAHFGVGLMDFEVIEFARENKIIPVAFSSSSQLSTDLPNLSPILTQIGAAHNISAHVAMYAYVKMYNITVLSTFDPTHPEWATEDIAIFNVTFTPEEMKTLDALTLGKRTCPDCFTDECQACAQALNKLGCDVGITHGGYYWGRSNPHGMECMACAGADANKDEVMRMCGNVSRGETLETIVPKACGI